MRNSVYDFRSSAHGPHPDRHGLSSTRLTEPARCCGSTITLPLWLGCAILCTILVGSVGFAPYLAQMSDSNVVVSEARNAYNTVLGITGGVLYEKYINELITLIIGFVSSLLQPQLMTAVNVSNPMWDREWQLFFTGVATTSPERRYYYVDLATSQFTAQLAPNISNYSNRLRIMGDANGVNVSAFRRVAPPRFQFEPVEGAPVMTLEFPLMVLVNSFLMQNESQSLVAPSLDPFGEMVYGLATTILTPSRTDIVGVLLELIPLAEMVNAAGARTATVSRFSGDWIVLDNLGALVACSLPALSNIYVPLGTPGAICSTVVYANKTISKCRHSLKTIQPIWPALIAAREAFDTQEPEGQQQVNWAVTVSYRMFKVGGEEYLVSASTPTLVKGGWWAAAITPIAPVYGPFFTNRNRIVVVVVCVCGGLALFVLLLTYVLMRPLSVLIEDMIAALRLQTQSDRYTREMLPAHVQAETRPTVICGGRTLQVLELQDIHAAVSGLHQLLDRVARMLPPPVIQAIRSTLAQRGGHRDDASGDSVGNSITSSEVNNHDLGPRRGTPQEPVGDANVEHMLTWFEDYYHAPDTAATQMDEVNPTMSPAAVEAPLLGRERAKCCNPVRESEVAEQARVEQTDVASTNASSILVQPNVSLRAPRRRGFFMAVSLEHIRCEPSDFAAAIAPLLSLLWQYGGEVELIERGVLLATFGCYDQQANSADRAVMCGIALVAKKYTFGVSPRENNAARPDQFDCPVVAIDCGWFETSALTCTLADGLVMRRQLVSSIARDVVTKLISLGTILNERLLISGDALRHVTPALLVGRAPVVVDHLRFDTRTWPAGSRRGRFILFSIPAIADGPSHALPSSALDEARKCEARTTAEGFRLMMGGQYAEAEGLFKALVLSGKSNRVATRLWALSSVFANIVRAEPLAEIGPYHRSERSLFDVGSYEDLLWD